MNLSEIRRLARQRLDDLTQPYLWSNEELNGFINESIREAAIRSRAIVDSVTPECCKILVTAGKQNYSIHPSVFQIKRVNDVTNANPLTRTSFEEMDGVISQWQLNTGQPTHFIYDFNHHGDDCNTANTITLYPIPNQAIELNLTVYRTQLDDLTDSDTPELPIHTHSDLVWWVCYLAYIKQDAEGLNVDKAMRFDALFTLAFGAKQSARQLEFRRKNRAIRTKGSYL